LFYVLFTLTTVFVVIVMLESGDHLWTADLHTNQLEQVPHRRIILRQWAGIQVVA